MEEQTINWTLLIIDFLKSIGIPSLVLAAWALYKTVVVPFRVRLVENWINAENARRERVQKLGVELYGKYYGKAVDNAPVSHDQISELCKDAESLMAASSGASSGISDLSKLLFRFFTLLEKKYNEAQTRNSRHSSTRNTSVYMFFLNVLGFINSEAQMIAPYPSLWKILLSKEIKRKSKVSKNLKKFIESSSAMLFSFFEQGERLSPYSIGTIIFVQEAINTRDEMIMVCAYRAIGERGAIERLLYSSKIYFPPTINLPIKHLVTDNITLDLIGFKFETELMRNEKRVTLFYTPRTSWYGLPSTDSNEIDPKYIPTKDPFLNKEFNPTDKIENLRINDESNILRYVVNEEFTREIFNKNKDELKKRMVKQVKNRNNRQ